MNVSLISQDLTVKINGRGAEICSVQNRSGLEYIWQANEDVWARHAPILFPIVGKLKDGVYNFENKNYELPQHGFARDMNFEMVHAEPDSCLFRLRSSQETKNKYPFEFILDVHYTLSGSVLSVNYNVKNPSAENIWFSIGAHPGFNCPLFKDESFEDYYLEFDRDSFLITKLNNGLLSDEKTSLDLQDKKLDLTPQLFDNDALVFENHQISKVSLVSKKSGIKITMNCKNWPFFGIWSKKNNREFICLEPWYGIADSVNSKHDFREKKGMILLKPKEEFACFYSTAFSPATDR